MGIENLQDGIYLARPTTDQAELVEASSGTVQATIEFELLNEGFQGTKIRWYGPITERAQANTIKALRNCGWKGTDWSGPIALDIDADVDLDIQNEEYQGKVRPKVKWVNKPGEMGGPKPMDPAKRKAFAMKMNGFLLKEGKPGNGGAAKPAQRPPQRQAAPVPAPSQHGGLTPEQVGSSEEDAPF